MNKTIKPEELGAEIAEMMALYAKASDAVIADALTAVSAELVPELKSLSPRSAGKPSHKKKKHYADDWKTAYYVAGSDQSVVAKNNQWRLTHLLENGHASRNGGRDVDGVPHISVTQEHADEKFIKLLKQGIEGL